MHVVALARFLDRLASLPRTGWLLRGVTDPESVAEHSFGVAVVAAALVDELRARGATVDGERVLRMALLHDAAEGFTGDVPMPAKSAELERALAEVEGALLAGVLAPHEIALRDEVERGETLEARVVHAADKLQMLVKALVYTEQRRGDVAEFFANAKTRAAFDGIAPAEEAYAEILELVKLAAARARGDHGA